MNNPARERKIPKYPKYGMMPRQRSGRAPGAPWARKHELHQRKSGRLCAGDDVQMGPWRMGKTSVWEEQAFQMEVRACQMSREVCSRQITEDLWEMRPTRHQACQTGPRGGSIGRPQWFISRGLVSLPWDQSDQGKGRSRGRWDHCSQKLSGELSQSRGWPRNVQEEDATECHRTQWLSWHGLFL